MLTYELSRASGVALYDQLYRFIRADIESGALEAHRKLPSKRALAAHLGISVITVEGAYDQLCAEGYVSASPRRGFFVCELPDAPGAKTALDAAPSTPKQAKESIPADIAARATSSLGAFPYDLWAKTMRQVLSEQNETSLLEAQEAQGSFALRQAVARHLAGHRGMDVDPDNIVIGAGAQILYGLIVQLLGRDKVYAVENPGYGRLASIYRHNNVDVRYVPMDGEGVLAGPLYDQDVRILHCMPSHQYPTACVMSASRRRELLAWAAATGSFIIEDDFDYEFRMTGRPIPSLQSLDTGDRVIYTNTFTKTLGPTFRIGYMVLPGFLARRFRDELGFYSSTVGALEQLTLAEFISKGRYERHINRQRTRHRKTLQAFREALAKGPGAKDLRLHHAGTGLHFVLSVESAVRPRAHAEALCDLERRMAARAQDLGAKAVPLSDFLLAGEPCWERPSFLIDVAGMDLETVSDRAAALAEAFCSFGASDRGML